LDSLPLLKNWLAWSIGNGKSVFIGQDPFIGCGSSYKLSPDLLAHLSSMQIYTIAHISHSSQYNLSGSHDWLDASYLNMEGSLALEWRNYIMNLRRNGVVLKEVCDSLVWSWNHASDTVSTKMAYEALVSQHCSMDSV
jgi:hypothetical protein